jgi:ABC-type multidrug transport system fused ATPase/permease subunit
MNHAKISNFKFYKHTPVADLNSLSHERLSGRITVRANSRVDDEVHRFSRRARQVFLLARRQAILSGVFFASFPFLGNVGLLAVMASGAGLVSSGAMTAGGLTSFLTYGIWLGISMKNGSEFWSDLQRSTGASARLFATLGSEPRLLPGPRPADIRGEIEFRDVTFAFPTRPQAPILSGFNLKVRAGTVVALVGESGSGKVGCFWFLFFVFCCVFFFPFGNLR